MKSKKEIKEQIAKFHRTIERDEKYLNTATGAEISLENRTVLTRHIRDTKQHVAALEWLFFEPTKEMLQGFNLQQ